MLNLMLDLGTWGIAHNAHLWVLGFFAALGIGFMAWDYKSTRG
jgi:hypothetical protein